MLRFNQRYRSRFDTATGADIFDPCVISFFPDFFGFYLGSWVTLTLFINLLVKEKSGKLSFPHKNPKELPKGEICR